MNAVTSFLYHVTRVDHGTFFRSGGLFPELLRQKWLRVYIAPESLVDHLWKLPDIGVFQGDVRHGRKDTSGQYRFAGLARPAMTTALNCLARISTSLVAILSITSIIYNYGIKFRSCKNLAF